MVKPTIASYNVTRGTNLFGMTTHKLKTDRPAIQLSLLLQALADEQFTLTGITDNAPLEKKYSEKLLEWRSRGYAAEMNYMKREGTTLSEPALLNPDLPSIISFLMPYSTTPRTPLHAGYGLIARYAWGRDYHNVVRRGGKRIEKRLRSLVGDRVFVKAQTDAIPLMERPLALRAGGGFIGNNSMLIRPGEGSLFLIGELFTNVEILRDIEIPRSSSGGCGSCRNCVRSCPTGAIAEDGMIDARKCISYLTIEHRGVFTPTQATDVGPWIFGCDICQEVCPFNHRALKLGEGRSSIPPKEQLKGGTASLEWLLSFSKESTFREFFNGTPFMRPGREGVLRNACAVAANTNFIGVAPRLRELAQSDESEVVRFSASQALLRIS